MKRSDIKVGHKVRVFPSTPQRSGRVGRLGMVEDVHARNPFMSADEPDRIGVRLDEQGTLYYAAPRQLRREE